MTPEENLKSLELQAEMEGTRNLYREMMDGGFPDINRSPWYFAEMNFPEEVFRGLTGGEMGNKNIFQNIDSMLEQCNDLGEYSIKEWKLFFEIIRVEGI